MTVRGIREARPRGRVDASEATWWPRPAPHELRTLIVEHFRTRVILAPASVRSTGEAAVPIDTPISPDMVQVRSKATKGERATCMISTPDAVPCTTRADSRAGTSAAERCAAMIGRARAAWLGQRYVLRCPSSRVSVSSLGLLVGCTAGWAVGVAC